MLLRDFPDSSHLHIGKTKRTQRQLFFSIASQRDLKQPSLIGNEGQKASSSRKYHYGER
jgi:hypothetical protein